ncbi:hypothetical protein FGG08_005085 [Glutinoglossum americanum]|uniref:Sphingolipid long chain base-responsive protein LSP1 n=1 Tax=Glutinoglossum americanum TaxID=1670608 RepID=A0A9P8HYW8_9PEZI|nr:hypothetical protein FGG08_005085 [Glutinoglossum americanum]
MAVLPPPYTPRKVSPPSRAQTLNVVPARQRNRSLSVRSKKDSSSGSGHAPSPAPKHRLTFASLRGNMQPELSKRLFKLIKTENHVISAYENASRERLSVASQLSDWGEATGDDAVSDLSDKLGVLLSEIGEQEDAFAQNLEDYRAILKQIRNTESSVQPSRDHKAKITDEIQKLKYKDPQSTKLVQLEQELVRAEAENLVAEAQLTNITRQKLKEAYDMHFAATIERAEKQTILARHGRQLLNLLDDTPVVPGDTRSAFGYERQARQILNDAEEELREWQPNLEPVESCSMVLGGNLMPAAAGTAATASVGSMSSVGSVGSVVSSRHGSPTGSRATSISRTAVAEEDIHPAHRKGSTSRSPPRRAASGSISNGGPSYEVESHALVV